MKKKTSIILFYALAGQIPLAVVGLFLFLRPEAAQQVVAEWGWGKTLLGALGLELVGLALIYLLRREASERKDERDVLIELKGYRIAFQFLSIVLLGMIVAEAVVGVRSPMLLISIVICIMNGGRVIAQSYFKRLH